MKHTIHIAKDKEYIYYVVNWEMDTSDIDIQKEKILEVTQEELCHILALWELWKAEYLEKKLDDE